MTMDRRGVSSVMVRIMVVGDVVAAAAAAGPGSGRKIQRRIRKRRRKVENDEHMPSSSGIGRVSMFFGDNHWPN